MISPDKLAKSIFTRTRGPHVEFVVPLRVVTDKRDGVVLQLDFPDGRGGILPVPAKAVLQNVKDATHFDPGQWSLVELEKDLEASAEAIPEAIKNYVEGFRLRLLDNVLTQDEKLEGVFERLRVLEAASGGVAVMKGLNDDHPSLKEPMRHRRLGISDKDAIKMSAAEYEEALKRGRKK